MKERKKKRKKGREGESKYIFIFIERNKWDSGSQYCLFLV